MRRNKYKVDQKLLRDCKESQLVGLVKDEAMGKRVRIR